MILLITISTNLLYSYADDVDNGESEVISDNEINEASNNIEDEPILNSRKCIVYDRLSKRIIFGKNENAKTAMASTTKIMTSIIVLENTTDLNKTITITAKAAGTGGSRLGLKANDKITINDLLYGLMLRSGNDSAVALALEVGGSIEGFAELMNNKAKELELRTTHFVTPHGLDNPEHYTTAYELAKLTDYALKNNKFAKIVGTKNYTIKINGYSKNLNNTNELLGVLNGVVGVKTGFTNNAGRCLVTETKRNDMDIITIVLGADTKKFRTKDSVKLIEYAYKNFINLNIKEKAEEEFESWRNINIRRINILKGKIPNIELKLEKFELDSIPVKLCDIDNIEYNINTILLLEAPVLKNTKIGTLTIKQNGEIVEIINILCNKTIERKSWQDYFIENLENIIK